MPSIQDILQSTSPEPQQPATAQPTTPTMTQPKPRPARRTGSAADAIQRIYEEEGAPVEIGLAMARQEGGKWDTPNSGAGARGPLQVIPATGHRFVTPQEFETPEGQIRASARYTKMLSERYGGDPYYTVAAYHAGEGAVDKYYKSKSPVPAYRDKTANTTTTEHVGKVLRNLQQIKGGQAPGARPIYREQNTLSQILERTPPDEAASRALAESLRPAQQPQFQVEDTNANLFADMANRENIGASPGLPAGAQQMAQRMQGVAGRTPSAPAQTFDWRESLTQRLNADAKQRDAKAGGNVSGDMATILNRRLGEAGDTSPEGMARDARRTVERRSQQGVLMNRVEDAFTGIAQGGGNLIKAGQNVLNEVTGQGRTPAALERERMLGQRGQIANETMAGAVTRGAGEMVGTGAGAAALSAVGVPMPLAYGGLTAAEHLDEGYASALNKGVKAGATAGMMQKAQGVITPLRDGIVRSLASRLVAGGVVGTGVTAMELADQLTSPDGKVDLVAAAQAGLPAAFITTLLPGRASSPAEPAQVTSLARRRPNMPRDARQWDAEGEIVPDAAGELTAGRAPVPRATQPGQPNRPAPRQLTAGEAPVQRSTASPSTPPSAPPENGLTIGEEITIAGRPIRITEADSMTVRGVDVESGQPRVFPTAKLEKTIGRKVAVKEPEAPRVETPTAQEMPAAPIAKAPKASKPARSYEEVQRDIDQRSSELEGQGVDPVKLYPPNQPKANFPDDWQAMPADLAGLYDERDNIGSAQLASSLGEIGKRLEGTGLSKPEISRVMERYALREGRTRGIDQGMAAQFTERLAREPITDQVESIYSKLAAERGLDVQLDNQGRLANPDQKTLKDAAKAVKAITDYFGIETPKEAKPKPAPKLAAAPTPTPASAPPVDDERRNARVQSAADLLFPKIANKRKGYYANLSNENREVAERADRERARRAADELIKAIDSKDKKALTDLLQTGNQTSRKFFEQDTGVKLGRTNQTAQEALGQWLQGGGQPQAKPGKQSKPIVAPEMPAANVVAEAPPAETPKARKNAYQQSRQEFLDSFAADDEYDYADKGLKRGHLVQFSRGQGRIGIALVDDKTGDIVFDDADKGFGNASDRARRRQYVISENYTVPTRNDVSLENVRKQRQEFRAKAHRSAVEEALRKDKPVAPEVLADYPDLQPKAEASQPEESQPWDSEAFNEKRKETIKASRESGNTHLDQVPAAIETMRGREIYYAHDPKVRGVIRTVDIRGSVYVDWSDKYSADKESASPTEDKIGRTTKTVYRTSLGPTDLKDYVLVNSPKSAAKTPSAGETRPRAESEAPKSAEAIPARDLPAIEKPQQTQPVAPKKQPPARKSANKSVVKESLTTKPAAEMTEEEAVDTVLAEMRAEESAQKAAEAQPAGKMSQDDVDNALMALFKKKKPTGPDVQFAAAEGDAPLDPDTYAAAKPLFLASIENAATDDVLAATRQLMTRLREKGMDVDELAEMRRYLVQFMKDWRAGNVKAEAEAVALVAAPAVERATREELIEQIAEAARMPMPEIVERQEVKGDNGLWYDYANVPSSVKRTDETRMRFAFQGPSGITTGKSQPSREALIASHQEGQDTNAETFRKQLRQMPDEKIVSQAKFWLKKDVELAPSESPAPKAEAKPAKPEPVEEVSEPVESKPTESKLTPDLQKRFSDDIQRIDARLAKIKAERERLGNPEYNSNTFHTLTERRARLESALQRDMTVLEPTAEQQKEVAAASKKEKMDRTGLTPTQKGYLLERLDDAEKILDEGEESFVKIPVPGDGQFTVGTKQEAEALKDRIAKPVLTNTKYAQPSTKLPTRMPLSTKFNDDSKTDISGSFPLEMVSTAGAWDGAYSTDKKWTTGGHIADGHIADGHIALRLDKMLAKEVAKYKKPQAVQSTKAKVSTATELVESLIPKNRTYKPVKLSDVAVLNGRDIYTYAKSDLGEVGISAPLVRIVQELFDYDNVAQISKDGVIFFRKGEEVLALVMPMRITAADMAELRKAAGDYDVAMQASPAGWERADTRDIKPSAIIPADWKTASKKVTRDVAPQEAISAVRSFYRPADDKVSRGIVVGNMATSIMLRHAYATMTETPLNIFPAGITIPRSQSDKFAKILRDVAKLVPGGEPLTKLADDLDRAAAVSPTVFYIDADPSRSGDDVEQTILHEVEIHGWQASIDPSNMGLVSDAWMKADPDYKRIVKSLRKKGYTGEKKAAIEALAYIGSGEWGSVGYTGANAKEKAAQFVERYLTEVARVHGVFAIKRLKLHGAIMPAKAKVEDEYTRASQSVSGDTAADNRGALRPDGRGSRTFKEPQQADQRSAVGFADGRPAGNVGSDRTALGQRDDFRRKERGFVVIDPAFASIKEVLGTKDVADKLAEISQHIRDTVDNLRRIASPVSRGVSAKETASITRARASEMARKYEQAEKELKDNSKNLLKLSWPERRAFIYAIEEGQINQLPAALQPLANVMRRLMDERRDAVQALGNGKLQSYYENYFPHIWKDPTKAASLMAEYFGKRPFEGSKSFLKQRTIPTIEHGIALGLEPVSENPIDLMLLKIREMDRYVMAHSILNEMKDKGILVRIKATHRVPDGYEKINDSVSTIFGAPVGGALTIRGYWIAPSPAAGVLNNYLSPGLRQYAVFRGYQSIANIMNQAQLGFSAFHLGFTSLDAAISKMALAQRQLRHGQIVNAAKSALMVPISPITNMLQGRKVYKAWENPGAMGPEWDEIASAIEAGGGRVKMDSFFATTFTKKMQEAFAKKNLPGVAVGLYRVPFAILEQASRPIMEYAVPYQKLGVAADMARHELDKLGPNASRDQVRATMAKVWDSVDNRMGQLVYDNLFWNKTFKDLLMASVRSVGWNLGTKREVAGGLLDFAKFGTNAAAKLVGRGGGSSGKPPASNTTGSGAWFDGSPDFTYRMDYVIAMTITVGTFGAILNYLFTGEGPKELKDYFFPKTGNKDEAGRPERLSLPAYIKDIYHYAHDPKRTILNKLHPALNFVGELWANEDFYGTEIWNADDPPTQKAQDVLKHLATAFTPFAVRGAMEERDRGSDWTKSVLPFIGLTPAPSSINKTPAEIKMSELMSARRPVGTRTKEEFERGQWSRKIVRDERMGKDRTAEMKEAVGEGKITQRQAQEMRRKAGQSPMTYTFNHMSLEDALTVWDLMNDDEKLEAKPILIKKAQNVIPNMPGGQREEYKKRVLDIMRQ